jgi:predicted membrane protein
MQETFKNVSIFMVFISALIVWNAAKSYIAPHFDFDYGRTVLMCVWSVCVVIIFHLLYHFLGRAGDKNIYLVTVITLVLMGALVYFQKLPLA